MFHAARLSLLLTVALGLCAGTTSAAHLPDFDHPHYPLVASDFIYVSFEPGAGANGTGRLTAIGYTHEVKYDATTVQGVDGDFTLLADIEIDGHATWGSLEVTEDYETGVRLFYSEQLSDFGFGALPGDDILDFLFVQEGDMLAPNGEPVGVILTVTGGASAPWDFGSDFYNSGNGYSETFYLPEPSVAALLALGATALLNRRRP